MGAGSNARSGLTVATVGRVLASLVVGGSAAIVIVGVAIAIFFNPIWVGLEQERSGADLATGYPIADVHAVTDAVLAEIFLGPGTFEQRVGNELVFDARERSHLADVRAVVLLALGLAVGALLVIAWAIWRRRGSPWLWRLVERTAAVLAVSIVVVGVAFTVAFDAAFELFHRLLFAGGTYTFDPRTDRLVQFFPERFWTETAVAVSAVALALALVSWWVGQRRYLRALGRGSGVPGGSEPDPAGAGPGRA